MYFALITYFGEPAAVACDGNCSKAWGINQRPHIRLSDDVDDICYLADGELPEAPADPGTYEGGYGKPESVVQFPNKWCVRECERCAMTSIQTNRASLPDWSVRRYNIPRIPADE